MKSNVKLIKIDGVEIPKFDEPKGEAYEKAMKEVVQKVDAKRKLKGESEQARATLKGEINITNNALMMADDDKEYAELFERRKQLQDKMSELVDYSGFNVNAYAKKLINDPQIQKLKAEADEEVTIILAKTRAYDKAVSELYQSIIEATRGILNNQGSSSSSSTRRTNAKFNEYNDSL